MYPRRPAASSVTGYVNAVGELEVDSLVSRLRTFSPLGEAVFSELGDGRPAVQAVAAHRGLPAVGAAPLPVRASGLAAKPEASASASTRPAVR